MGGSRQVIGYRYFMSVHMGIGRGPLNEIVQIRVGDLVAHGSPILLGATGQEVRINKPNLFGGEKKEGGIDGSLYAYNGSATQVLQPAKKGLRGIAASLGGDVPNFRGVVTIWFDGMVSAMSPYPKEWSFRVRRSTAGWYENIPWYPAKARIVLGAGSGGEIHAMNGAHILYEVNTNPEWGRGMPAEAIDADSFVSAANTLCAEGLGLCLPWFRQESIKEFVPVVINHIGGVQYLDRETGKLTLRLIRGDYDPDDLPLFTPDTGLIDVIDDDASGEETSFNEIIIKGFDPRTKEDIMVRAHNLAAIQSQGEIISNTIEYRGLPTRDLCARVAIRELKVQLPLRRLSVVLDRRGWRIAPGMPFRISDPRRGIENLILRAGEAVDGPLTDGRITIKAMEDVFGMPETSYIAPPSNDWTPPSFTAVPSPEERMYEINWRDLLLNSTIAQQQAVDAGSSFVAIIAKNPPETQTQGFDIITSAVSGEYDRSVERTVEFTGWMVLLADIGPLDTTLEVEDENIEAFLDEFDPGMVVLIDDEQIVFVAFDEISRLATLRRAVADTIPATHSAGATIWLVDEGIGTDTREYQEGETVYGKALTRTSADLLDESAATELSVEARQRVFRPYPPGNVQVDGVTVYALEGSVFAAPVLTWAHRDRIVQADVPVGHEEGSVGPEPGVTYNLRVFAADGVTLLREEDAGAVDTWTYDAAKQTADGDPESVWVELESVREELASYFNYRFNVAIVLLGDLRLTEDGSTRITESNDFRILED